MNAFFAASLFDNPLVIAAIVLGGMFVNWISQRRKAAEADQSPLEQNQPPTTGKPAGGFDIEETLRQLLGEQAVPRQSTPPLIYPPAPKKTPPPRIIELSDETPKPVSTRRISSSFAVPQTSEQAAERFEQLNEQGRHPAKAQDLRRRHHPRAGSRAALWSNRQKLRQAFVASLVFGPPKSLEES